MTDQKTTKLGVTSTLRVKDAIAEDLGIPGLGDTLDFQAKVYRKGQSRWHRDRYEEAYGRNSKPLARVTLWSKAGYGVEEAHRAGNDLSYWPSEVVDSLTGHAGVQTEVTVRDRGNRFLTNYFIGGVTTETFELGESDPDVLINSVDHLRVVSSNDEVVVHDQGGIDIIGPQFAQDYYNTQVGTIVMKGRASQLTIIEGRPDVGQGDGFFEVKGAKRGTSVFIDKKVSFGITMEAGSARLLLDGTDYVFQGMNRRQLTEIIQVGE